MQSFWRNGCVWYPIDSAEWHSVIICLPASNFLTKALGIQWIFLWNSTVHNLSIDIYIIIKLMRALWLVNHLWFIVPVKPWKFRVSSELLYKSNRPQVFMVYSLINHLWCWKNTRIICKSLACGSWFTNSSCVLPTSRVVYQAIYHRNLWFIA